MKFILNTTTLLEETQFIELKKIEGQNPVNIIKNAVDEYVVAFLNSSKNEEGSIFWGIDDNRVVLGVKLDASKRDKLRQDINNQLGHIDPPISCANYTIRFHPIYNDIGNELKDCWVVEVKVTKDSKNAPIYFASGKTCFVKTDSGRKEVSGIRLVEHIRVRHKLIIESNRVNNFSEIIGIFNRLTPILHWIDKPIPANQAEIYFNALQENFYFPPTPLLDSLNNSLLSGTDHLLRVINSLPNLNGYSFEKMNIACQCFSTFLERNHCLNEFKGDTRELLAVFKQLLVSEQLPLSKIDLDYEHILLIRLLVTLLEYQIYVVSQRKVKLLDIPPEITKSATRFFIHMTEKNLSFVEKTDCFDELSKICECNWEALVLQHEVERKGTKREAMKAFVHYFFSAFFKNSMT